MSEADRQKWNARYAEGAYAGRTYPGEYLVSRVAGIEPGPALDLACGAGRNARYLAACGFDVDAIDISSVGLERARAQADAEGVTVNWIEQDLLEDPNLPRSDYQLIILFRFVAPELLNTLPAHLRPGGFLVVEEHLQTDDQVAGPRGNRFRVAPGALAASLAGMPVLESFEGLVLDPDGEQSAVARITVQKPLGGENRDA